MRVFTIAFSLAVFGSSLTHAAHAKPQVTPGPGRAKAPSFEVATIKPSRPDEPAAVQINGCRFVTAGTSLVDILKYAYSLHASEIVGGPEWIGTTKFDLLADPDTEERPSSDQMKSMVQELVADRFHFAAHRDRKELPVFAIVVAKGGPKLIASTRDPNSTPSVAGGRAGRFGAGNASMTDLAAFLQRFVMDRPVVDQTGLTGRFDVTFRWTPDELVGGGGAPHPDDPSAPPGLFTAFEEQLGVKLIAVRALTDVLVVDHVELPTPD